MFELQTDIIFTNLDTNLETPAIVCVKAKCFTPAVVQQEAEQTEQDESHASQYGQQKHSVVRADVLCNHWTCYKDMC